MKTNLTRRGFSLVEMIIYIAILSIVVSALTVTAVSLLSTYANLAAEEDVSKAGTVALERITRELRFAESVDVGASTLGTSTGVLVLDTIDATDNPTTLTFGLSDGRIMLTEGAGSPSPLTHDTVNVTNLVFTHVIGVETEAVRVELTLERPIRQHTIVTQFRTFIILRGS